MADKTGSLAEVALTPESEHEWELLRELVDFADRLVVAFIFADRFAVRVLRARRYAMPRQSLRRPGRSRTASKIGDGRRIAGPVGAGSPPCCDEPWRTS
jgi:hypothetical protein